MRMDRRFTFPKPEHLRLRDDIARLFASGSRSLTVFPLRLAYRTATVGTGTPPVKVLMCVPKRHFRHAVDRNRVKRLMREAYRHHKHLLLEQLPEGQGLHVGFFWLSEDLPTAEGVEKHMARLLQQLSERLAPSAVLSTP